MSRKRKIPIATEEEENVLSLSGEDGDNSSNFMASNSPMGAIMYNVQLSEASHQQYIRELKQLYCEMDYNDFISILLKVLQTAMVADVDNEYAETMLLFVAKFLSSFDGKGTHPLLYDVIEWFITKTSQNSQIRCRICQFLNKILEVLRKAAALDESISDDIKKYILNQLHDVSANVRLQAVLALKHLQVADNPDDPVIRTYQLHLSADPSPRVRQAVITCMGRNHHTIPYILERLRDIDERVRRHTYLHMSSYPVHSYEVSQRVMLLQQGLNDRSESVRKVVVTIMLQQWIESYQKDIIALISALKSDSTEVDIERFRKVVKQTLKEILKRQKKDDLLACLPVEMEGELHHCVPLDRLTMENALYWQCLTEYFQFEMAEEIDLILPELSTFCTYVEKFCETQNRNLGELETLTFQYKLLSLLEILCEFDLGDEIGRANLQKLLESILKKFHLEENSIDVLVRCAENLITDQSCRQQFLVEIIEDICCLNNKQSNVLSDSNVLNHFVANTISEEAKLKLTSCKVKIMELEERKISLMNQKNYIEAHEINKEKGLAVKNLLNALEVLPEHRQTLENLKKAWQLCEPTNEEDIIKALKIAFYMMVSPKVRSLDPIVHKLYSDFICHHISSSEIVICDWAMKCATACSMLYGAFAKDVFDVLRAQLFKTSNVRIWETCITSIFELLDRYGLETFPLEEEENENEFHDCEDTSNVLNCAEDAGVVTMMSQFLDTSVDVCIKSAVVLGLCRLILRGFIKSSAIIEKLLLCYFNPTTDPKIEQMLSVFLESLMEQKKYDLLQPCLVPILKTVLSAPVESPYHQICPETLVRFMVDSTYQQISTLCGDHIHNKLAIIFLEEMLSNLSNKKLCQLLAKELLTLELRISQNIQMGKMRELAHSCRILSFQTNVERENSSSLFDNYNESCDVGPRPLKNIISFKKLLDDLVRSGSEEVMFLNMLLLLFTSLSKLWDVRDNMKWGAKDDTGNDQLKYPALAKSLKKTRGQLAEAEQPLTKRGKNCSTADGGETHVNTLTATWDHTSENDNVETTTGTTSGVTAILSKGEIPESAPRQKPTKRKQSVGVRRSLRLLEKKQKLAAVESNNQANEQDNKQNINGFSDPNSDKSKANDRILKASKKGQKSAQCSMLAGSFNATEFLSDNKMRRKTLPTIAAAGRWNADMTPSIKTKPSTARKTPKHSEITNLVISSNPIVYTEPTFLPKSPSTSIHDNSGDDDADETHQQQKVRPHQLTSKKTCINLLHRGPVPLPMSEARPTHQLPLVSKRA